MAAADRASRHSTITTAQRMSAAPAHQRATKRSPPAVMAKPSAKTGSSANSSPTRPAGSVRCASTWSSGATTLPHTAR